MATKKEKSEERVTESATYPELVAEKLLENGFTEVSSELNVNTGRIYYLRESVKEARVLPTT